MTDDDQPINPGDKDAVHKASILAAGAVGFFEGKIAWLSMLSRAAKANESDKDKGDKSEHESRREEKVLIEYKEKKAVLKIGSMLELAG